MTKRVVILVLCFFVALFSFPILTACGKKEHLPAQLTHNHEHLNTDDVCDKCGWQVLLKTNDGEQVYLVKEGNVSAEYYCETITKYSLANPLVSVYISNNVTCIGSSAFRGCFNLSSIIIPDSVTIIGQQSFYGCDGLTSITIPNSVTTIEDNAFADCNNLTSRTISRNFHWPVSSLTSGGLWPALQNSRWPVDRSANPRNIVTNMPLTLSSPERASLIRVQISAGIMPWAARVRKRRVAWAMKSEAGTPLPETSPTAK